MSIKRYRITEDRYDLEVTLQVDHDVLTPGRATKINNFWSNPDERLAVTDDDPVQAVILMAARRFMFCILVHPLGSVDGLQSDFDEAEGWGGSFWSGITLIDFDGSPQIELYDLEVDELGD